MGRKAFFLDRDGVLNAAGHVNHPKELIMLPQAAEAVKRLCDADYAVFVVTNQGGVGQGHMTQKDLDAVHEKLLAHIGKAGGQVMEIRACTHKPHARCYCRKPKPGMLKDLILKYDIDPISSVMVGDRDTDVRAGRKAGLSTVLIGAKPGADAKPDWVFPSLWEAVDYLLSKENEEDERTE